MKKYLVLALAAAMALGSFAGCSSEEESASTANSSAASSSSVSEAVSEESSESVAEESSTPSTDAGTSESTPEEPAEEPEKPVIEADPNAITFEDGDIATAFNIDVDENGKGNGDASGTNLTVAEYNNSKMLKIEVLEQDDNGNYKVPKVGFDVDALVGAENVGNIKSFTMDIYQVAVGTFIGDDGTEALCPGNLMGGFGGNSPTTEDPSRWVSFGEFSAAEWTWDWVYTQFQGKILLDSNKFESGQEGCTIVLMRWGIPNQADLYIDNITFYDADGNSIPIIYTGSGDAAEGTTDEAVSEEATESVAE